MDVEGGKIVEALQHIFSALEDQVLRSISEGEEHARQRSQNLGR